MKNVFSAVLFLIICVNLNAQIIEFEDDIFESYMVNSSASDVDNCYAFNEKGHCIKVDTNGDKKIEISEALKVYELRIPGTNGYAYATNPRTPIKNLIGIEHFINLEELRCERNSITKIDLTKNINLKYLNCERNYLNKLDVTKNTKLVKLYCSYNYLTELNLTNNSELEIIEAHAKDAFDVVDYIRELDLSQNVKLKNLFIANHKVTDLDVSKNTTLEEINCSNNKITKIDFSNNVELKSILISDNVLTQLDVSKNTLLKDLACDSNEIKSIDLINNKELFSLELNSNQIENLDVSLNPKLKVVDLSENKPLTSLNIKNGVNSEGYVNLKQCENLKQVCADNFEIDRLNYHINKYEIGDVKVSTYCTLTPGGKSFIINGKSEFCVEEIVATPFVKFEITDGNNSSIVFSNKKGEFKEYAIEGVHTVKPLAENYEYYNITPKSVEYSFPDDGDNVSQSFCLTPNGIHKDLDITISPIGTPARPGFDSDYTILFSNKGNTTLAGTIELEYNSEIIDYIDSTTSISSDKDGILTFDYEDLKPFESRSIIVTFNVNSPMETPPVNNGDVLCFIAKIFPWQADETPQDNIHKIRQTVVGSKDPNDKTCLEGTDVLPEMIGEYVHYRIRFENTGTFAAENIVVVDEIDESKFDVSTLVPLDASHDFETRITGNKVEFIFEGIQLPFEDATNDGYVIFKIKTLPTLKLGDSFSNQASIYFDFNFPIITNNETTTIVEEHLRVGDFDFTDELTVYPNPVADRLYITSKKSAQLQSLEIYNLQGQMVLSVPQVSKMSFEVSHLPKGTYLLKVKTDRGVGTTKVVKE